MTRAVRRARAPSTGSASSASSSSNGRPASSKKGAAAAMGPTNSTTTGEMSSTSSTCSAAAVDAANALTFPRKLAEMLEHEGNVIVWSSHGLSFYICDNDALAYRLLPQYFRRKWGEKYREEIFWGGEGGREEEGVYVCMLG